VFNRFKKLGVFSIYCLNLLIKKLLVLMPVAPVSQPVSKRVLSLGLRGIKCFKRLDVFSIYCLNLQKKLRALVSLCPRVNKLPLAPVSQPVSTRVVSLGLRGIKCFKRLDAFSIYCLNLQKKLRALVSLCPRVNKFSRRC